MKIEEAKKIAKEVGLVVLPELEDNAIDVLFKIVDLLNRKIKRLEGKEEPEYIYVNSWECGGKTFVESSLLVSSALEKATILQDKLHFISVAVKTLKSEYEGDS